ncbi:MAG: sugar ABC transporter permease, partial [Candidatus Omnitrophica bacterium]|nr:sugar ABC transporter permease [Candidatus Omnitrophota bacterium]
CDREIRMKNFYRLVFFIPPVLSEIVVGMAWRFIINDIDGANVINRMLAGVGLPNLMHNWLSSPNTALTTVAIVHCWKGFGWAFVILFAGLQTIPEQLYEAAKIDGANAWQQFRKITIPLVMPVITLVVVLTILGTMQAFAMILALNAGAGGETTVPVMIIFSHLGGASKLAGLACAEGLILGAILVAVSFSMFFVSKKVREKYGVLPS